MRRKMITVSTALALMLSLAGCTEKKPVETTPATSPVTTTTTEAVNETVENTTVANTTTAESTTAPVTTAEINTPLETAPEETTASVGSLTILSQPQDAYVIPDSNTRFTIEATSEKPISYLWEYRMNENDTWKTSPHGGVTSKYHSVYVSKHTEWDGVQFRCIVCEPGGTPIYSEPATLHIITPLTTEYFPDEGFRRLVSEFDQDHDGNLSPEEREAVTELECLIGYYSREDASSTHSLAGIQYFSELNKLSCSGLNLPELDLSHNPELKELHCYDLKLLSELDLTQNLKLEKLEISLLGINELDLSHNSELKELDIYNLSLSELDLSHNSELKRLYCHDFDLTKLDVSHNLELELLDCHYLGLTELDVTQNRKLADLHCENNKLTALDLSNNVALSTLECRNNQLTSLDLSANQELVNLNCAGNSMSELNLSGLSKLEIVECFCNPSLKVNTSNCSSSIEFIIDATALISADSDNFTFRKRYDFAPTEDGYYSAKLTGDMSYMRWEEILVDYGFEYSYSFRGASADQNTLTLQEAHLLSDSGDFYDCGTISLPLAQTVKYEYRDIYGETSNYTANDFNTFYSAMLAEYNNCFSEETTGELKLSIHILNGSIDEITIQIDQYP